MPSLSTREKWCYAIGQMPFSVKDAAFVNFVVFYYTQVHGLSGALTGLAMFLALCWDAITDPLVGSWSDSLRTRHGRRHLPMALGGPPTALLFLAVFNPPAGFGPAGVFLWLLGSSVLLRSFLTVYFIPYSALGAELTTDYDERTVIAKARIAMGWLATMALPAVGFATVFNTSGGTDGRLIEENYHTYGLFSAVIAGASFALCFWGTRSLIPQLPRTNDASSVFHWRQPLQDLRDALNSRNFRFSIGVKLLFGMCAGVYTTMALYLGTYFWEFSAEQLAALVIPTALATLTAFAILKRLGRRYDKPQLLVMSCLLLAVNAGWFIGARLLNLLPPNGHPLIFWLQLLNTAIGVLCIVSLQVVSVSLLADILDEHELNSGRRQEGIFFATAAFVGKATTGLGALLAGLVIDAAGLEPGLAPGTLAPATLQSLGLFTVVIICALSLFAFTLARCIRLGRDDHKQIQAHLSARHS